MASDNEQNNQNLILQQTVKSLAALNSLFIQASQCADENSLIFHILNHTVSFLHYDRAIILNRFNAKILGVSGTVKPSDKSALLSDWKTLARDLKEPYKIQILTADSFTKNAALWSEYCKKNKTTSVLWVPLTTEKDPAILKNKFPPVLWLERWNGRIWRENEIKSANPLQSSYAGLWKIFSSRKGGSLTKKRKGWLVFPLIALLIYFLHSYQIAERIVAPCEIVPENPVSVTAEIDGVIEDVKVTPGIRIKKGDLLVEFTDDIFQEEFNAARQQVKITLSELRRAQAEAVTDAQARSHLLALENQLKKDQTRLSIAKYRIDRSRIYANENGVVMMNDPHEWEGKPVMTGERIMLLIEPDVNKIQIYLPLNDKINFPDNAQVKIVLNTDSAVSRSAHLTYLSEHTTISPTGIPCFLAEAKFDAADNSSSMRMGVQGTAIIFGQKVPLGYWLIRRPLAAVRNFFGI